jgi:hypothetical protein
MAEEIVERLKAEGQLTRNTGTNSIRAVSIQMDRFEEIFQTISEQITMQTQLLADMVEVSVNRAKIDAEQSEKETVQQQQAELAAAQTEAAPVESETSRKESKEGPGLFSMLRDMGLGGLTKLLIGGALLGGGLFAAYNIAKGFVDEMYDGAWSNFESGLVDLLSNVDLEAIKNGFTDLLAGVVAVVGGIAALKLTLLTLKTALAATNLTNALRGTPPIAAPTASPRAAPAAAGTRASAASRLARGAGRLAWPVAVAALAYEFYSLWERGPLAEEERAALGAETEDLASRVSEFPEEMNVPPVPLDPLEESRKQLETLQETRERMLRDADENAATSGFYIEPNTNRIDRQIEDAKENVQNILRQRSTGGDTELEIIPPNQTSIDNSDAFRVISSPEDILRGSTGAASVISEKLAAAVEAAVINMPIIVNNSPTVAPIINNVQGGPNINSTSIFGSGGGDRSRNPYGITNGAN